VNTGMVNVRVSNDTHELLKRMQGYMQLTFGQDYSFDDVINTLCHTFLTLITTKFETLSEEDLKKIVEQAGKPEPIRVGKK